MIKINRLLAKFCSHLDSEALELASLDNRLTGETTGYLLSFLGNVLSNPNKTFNIRENYYGYKAQRYEFETLKVLVDKLELNFIEFCQKDLTVTYRLYECYDNEYDMYRKLGGKA